MFVDDTNIVLSNANLVALETLANKELSHLATWLKANKLSLNVKKTHYMVFANKRYPAKIDLMIDNERIGETCKTKFLGVIIDNKLTWRIILTTFQAKAPEVIELLLKLENTWMNILCWVSTILSFTLTWHIVIKYGEIHIKHTLKRLKSSKTEKIRIIAGVPRFHLTDPLFSETKLLKFMYINQYFVGHLIFRMHNHELQNIFSDFFTVNNELHTHTTRQALHYHIPSPKTNLGKSCLRYHGAVAWNKILARKIPTKTSEFVLSGNSKSNIILELLWILVTWLKCVLCMQAHQSLQSLYCHICPTVIDSLEDRMLNSNLF